MKKRLLVIMVTGFLLSLTIGAFSNVTANKINEKPVKLGNDEGDCSVNITFITNYGEVYLWNAHFQIELVFSIPNNKEYHDWVDKEFGAPSIKIENLPNGLYKLYEFGFSAGYIRFGLPKYFYLGSGGSIPAHRDITIKIRDLSWPEP